MGTELPPRQRCRHVCVIYRCMTGRHTRDTAFKRGSRHDAMMWAWRNMANETERCPPPPLGSRDSCSPLALAGHRTTKQCRRAPSHIRHKLGSGQGGGRGGVWLGIAISSLPNEVLLGWGGPTTPTSHMGEGLPPPCLPVQPWLKWTRPGCPSGRFIDEPFSLNERIMLVPSPTQQVPQMSAARIWHRRCFLCLQGPYQIPVVWKSMEGGEGVEGVVRREATMFCDNNIQACAQVSKNSQG